MAGRHRCDGPGHQADYHALEELKASSSTSSDAKTFRIKGI